MEHVPTSMSKSLSEETCWSDSVLDGVQQLAAGHPVDELPIKHPSLPTALAYQPVLYNDSSAAGDVDIAHLIGLLKNTERYLSSTMRGYVSTGNTIKFNRSIPVLGSFKPILHPRVSCKIFPIRSTSPYKRDNSQQPAADDFYRGWSDRECLYRMQVTKATVCDSTGLVSDSVACAYMQSLDMVRDRIQEMVNSVYKGQDIEVRQMYSLDRDRFTLSVHNVVAYSTRGTEYLAERSNDGRQVRRYRHVPDVMAREISKTDGKVRDITKSGSKKSPRHPLELLSRKDLQRYMCTLHTAVDKVNVRGKKAEVVLCVTHLDFMATSQMENPVPLDDICEFV